MNQTPTASKMIDVATGTAQEIPLTGGFQHGVSNRIPRLRTRLFASCTGRHKVIEEESQQPHLSPSIVNRAEVSVFSLKEKEPFCHSMKNPQYRNAVAKLLGTELAHLSHHCSKTKQHYTHFTKIYDRLLEFSYMRNNFTFCKPTE